MNKRADALANEVMDRQESFERWPVEDQGMKGLSLVIFTAGGVRHGVRR